MLEGVTSIYYSIFNLSKIPPPPPIYNIPPPSNQDFLDPNSNMKNRES